METIVLSHGYPGFARIGRLEYFNGVAEFLRQTHGVEVLTPVVGPLGTIRTRAEELKQKIQSKLNGKRAHIIAHSVGGLDARFLASPAGLDGSGLVRSVTTIVTPHLGTSLAELALGLLQATNLGELLSRDSAIGRREMETITNELVGGLAQRLRFLFGRVPFVGVPGGIFPSLKTTLEEAGQFIRGLFEFEDEGLRELTRGSMKEFSKKVVDADGVDYCSYAGVSGPGAGDILPPIFYLSYLIVTSQEGPNDGWISVKSSTRDPFKKELPADHAQQIGHDLSPVSRIFVRKSFNHLQLYSQIVRDLL